jgi:hypothetical protein
VRRVRELGFERCASGTKALTAAHLEAIERAQEAARQRTARITREAEAFGRRLTNTWLQAAGWSQEDIDE